MAFELKNVVPWGRNLEEYSRMFLLSDSDLDLKILGVGDGPASFNAEMTKLKKNVVSLDPIYAFSKLEIANQIELTKSVVMQQMEKNKEQFLWTQIKSLEALESIRVAAMDTFLQDYEFGKRSNRYIEHAMPNRIPFEASSFQLALSSHFLFLYEQLGLEFHIQSIEEMIRVAREVRIFPLLSLNGLPSIFVEKVAEHFSQKYSVQVHTVPYEFQRNGNQMLSIISK